MKRPSVLIAIVQLSFVGLINCSNSPTALALRSEMSLQTKLEGKIRRWVTPDTIGQHFNLVAPDRWSLALSRSGSGNAAVDPSIPAPEEQERLLSPEKLPNHVDHVNTALEVVFRSKSLADATKALPELPFGWGFGWSELGVGALGVLAVPSVLYYGLKTSGGPAVMVGAGLAAAGGYWWIGGEMGVIAAFKGDMKKALAELEQIKPLVEALKDQNGQLEHKIDDALVLTDSMKQQVAQAVKISGDNATLAAILSESLKETRKHQQLLAAMVAELSKDDQAKLLKEAGIESIGEAGPALPTIEVLEKDKVAVQAAPTVKPRKKGLASSLANLVHHHSATPVKTAEKSGSLV